MIKVFLGLFFLAAAGMSHSATITVAPGSPIQEFKFSSGAVITDTSTYTVQVGYFTTYTHGVSDIEGSAFRNQLSNSSLTFKDSLSSFVALGSGQSNLGPAGFRWNISALTGAGAGKFSINQSMNNAALVFASTSASNVENRVSQDGLVRGTRMFILAYNAATLEAATDFGVYSADAWRVPGGVGMASSTSTSLVLNLATVDTAAEVFHGSLGSLVLAPAAVPEPGVSLLALASLGLLARRRR